MNIVHITHGKVNPFGEIGTSRTVYYLNKYQKLTGHNSQIWSVVDGVKKHETYKRDEFVAIEMFPRVFSFRNKSKEILEYIKENKNKIDICHLHMMWMYDKNVIAGLLKSLNIPYIVTAHGAYTADKIYEKWWKKIPAKYFYELRFLNNANAVHAVTYEELSTLRQFGINRPIFVVPNGIELNEIPDNINYNFFSTNPILKNKIKFCWVGNLKLCKNIDGLINAVALVPLDIRNKIAMIIIGPEGGDAKGHYSYLKNLVQKYNLDNIFHFVGPLYGKDKYDALASSDIYIHPSWSEGVSFALLDAMAVGKPCVITRTCAVAYFYNRNFFIMIEPYPDDIARGIMEALERKSEWRQLGQNARHLIEQELIWQKISAKIIENYAKIITKHNANLGISN